MKPIETIVPAHFPDGHLPPRVYSKSGKPVLLATDTRAETLLMLLRASDKRPERWLQGWNDNGWHFVYSKI
jgi:hypothetical protein